MEPARRGKGAVDQLFRNGVVQRIEEPDLLAGMPQLTRKSRQRACLAGKKRPEIDDRDLRRRRGVILDPEFLEQIHPVALRLRRGGL